MRFLEPNEIEEWCGAHGVEFGGDGHPRPDGALSHRARVSYAQGRQSGRENAMASACVAAIPVWSECLLWVTGWDIWPSSEDWPRYYAARGGRSERRSLGRAPGHLFFASEAAALAEFLTLVLENAWDALLLPACVEPDARARVRVSHDEWVELESTETIDLAVSTV